jgi:mannose-6-phosphate isomerase-like protein (cupin superfamily)
MKNDSSVRFITGEKITFVQTTEDTNGEVRVELPSNKGNPLHYHPTYEEIFTSIEGDLEITLEKQIVDLKPGETIKVPKFSNHKFWNRTNQNVTFEVETRPAQHQEAFFRIVYGLMIDGKTRKNGLPKNIWHIVYLFELFGTYPAHIPMNLLNGIMNPLIKIAQSKKVDQELNQYLPSYLQVGTNQVN